MDEEEQSSHSSSDSEEVELAETASVIDDSESEEEEEEDEDEIMSDVDAMSDIIPLTTKPAPKRGRPKQTTAVAKKKGKMAKSTAMPPDADMDEELYHKIQRNEIVVDSSDEEEDNDDAEYQKLAHSSFAHSITQPFTVYERPGKDEIEMLTTIHRDKDNHICDPTHTTIPWLTNYERARILSVRVSQLDSGAIPLVSVPPEMKYTNYTIAVHELEQKKLSFIIQRPLPNNQCEYWKVEDLTLIH